MIRAAEASVARIAILPLQDPLELGSEARMNYPLRPAHNWAWRCPPELLTPAVAARLAELATLYGRAERKESRWVKEASSQTRSTRASRVCHSRWASMGIRAR